ncbi:hypothetical protein J3Q64DRAFT_1709039, partial [Phycomyces blakesleeanus]
MQVEPHMEVQAQPHVVSQQHILNRHHHLEEHKGQPRHIQQDDHKPRSRQQRQKMNQQQFQSQFQPHLHQPSQSPHNALQSPSQTLQHVMQPMQKPVMSPVMSNFQTPVVNHQQQQQQQGVSHAIQRSNIQQSMKQQQQQLNVKHSIKQNREQHHNLQSIKSSKGSSMQKLMQSSHSESSAINSNSLQQQLPLAQSTQQKSLQASSEIGGRMLTSVGPPQTGVHFINYHAEGRHIQASMSMHSEQVLVQTENFHNAPWQSTPFPSTNTSHTPISNVAIEGHGQHLGWQNSTPTTSMAPPFNSVGANAFPSHSPSSFQTGSYDPAITTGYEVINQQISPNSPLQVPEHSKKDPKKNGKAKLDFIL